MVTEERQEARLRENMAAVEAERVCRGLSFEEVSLIVFARKEGVAGVKLEEAEKALLRLCPEEAQEAKNQAYREIAKRNLEAGRGRRLDGG